MRTLLLRGTQQLTERQYRVVCSFLAAILFVVWVTTNRDLIDGFTRVDLNALSRPAFTTMNKETKQSELDIQSAYKSGLSVAKLSGLGGIGESYAQIKSNNVSLQFENELEKDAALSAMLNFRKIRVNDINNEIYSHIENAKLEVARLEQIESITCDPADITKISNMTKEQIGQMIEGTWLEGKEDILYQVEQEEGINVFFIYAVSTLESDHGRSYRATTRSNYYGLETKTNYGSYEDNTMFFGGMMNRLYISNGNIGVDDIGPIYCPPNRNWENVISEIMISQYEKITTLTVA